jgi:hypothetical protein
MSMDILGGWLLNNVDQGEYMSSQNGEKALNAAIIRANISESFEEYLKIFDAFYADDIEVRDETSDEPIRGKSRVRSILFDFLVPLHIMAEVGGLSTSIHETSISGDIAGETHSAWTMRLKAPSGSSCTLSWSVVRRWNGSHVVYERHYDHHQSGGPLTVDDFNLNAAGA